MVTKEVIELAVAGGWDEGDEFLNDLQGKNGADNQEAAELYLFGAGFLTTSVFWQALGRSLDWDKYSDTPGVWKSQALLFFERCLSDKLNEDEIERYWRELIAEGTMAGRGR